MREVRLHVGRGYAYSALFFAAASLGLLATVSVARFGRAEITVSTAQAETSAEFVVTVRDVPSPVAGADPAVVPGKIIEDRREISQTFPATGAAQVVATDTVGTVTLINTTPRQQVLVATTRLLSPQPALVRLSRRVLVPAQGQITATVYADAPESFSDVPAGTRLTIPGLAPGLQPLIYGAVKTPLRRGGSNVPMVTEQDLASAYAALSDQIATEAKEQISASLSPREQLYTQLVEREVVKKSADAAAGDQRASLTATLEARVVTIAFDEARLIAAVSRHLAAQLPFTHALRAVDPARLRYEVQRYDAERREASLKVAVTASTALRPGSPILQPAAVAGLTQAQIVALLSRYPEIERVEVKFFPSRLRRAPRLTDRITFIVQ